MWPVYTIDRQPNLKHKFTGSEQIHKNYSQANQDMFVLMMLDGKRNGTFLEIGAHEPINISNTYLLEKDFDWNGISIDIVEHGSFRSSRKSNYIIADALTLDYKEVFEKYNLPKQIDYLSIDIEPSINTFNALKKLPLNEYRFSVITFEHDYYGGDPHNVLEESRKLLASLGYKLVASNISNVGTQYPYEDWYVDPTVVSNDIVEKVINNDDTVKFCEDIILHN